MSYRFVDSFRAGPGWNQGVPFWSCSKAAYKPVWHTRIPLLSVQWINSWWWTEELSETCRVSYHNKFVKLIHLVGFIIKKKDNCVYLLIVNNTVCPTRYRTGWPDRCSVSQQLGALQTHSFSFLTQRTYSCSNFVAISSLVFSIINLLKPNDIYICRTAALTSRRYILNIYSTNIHTEYFKHAA